VEVTAARTLHSFVDTVQATCMVRWWTCSVHVSSRSLLCAAKTTWMVIQFIQKLIETLWPSLQLIAMKSIAACCCIGAVWLTSVDGVNAAGVENAPSDTPAARAEAWIHSKRKEKYYSAAPGIAVLTVDPDSGIHTFGDGVQMLGATTEVDGDTMFEIGSLSKTMTALGITALAAKGTLSYDDPVQKWLGDDFKLGPYDYVSSTVTIKDLMAHRSGLAEGQGDTMGGFFPPNVSMYSLGKVDPVHTFREKFDYSNTGWNVAGEVLRAAAKADSWCSALHSEVVVPLGLKSTFCSRNEIPDSTAEQHLAAVHKHDPCGPNGSEGLAAYDFVLTGSPTEFAWGAADAAGSVISSVNDMSVVVNLLVNRSATSSLLPRNLLDELMTGQMVVEDSWMKECGIATDGYSQVGRGNAAGFGFDIACEISPYLSPGTNDPSTESYAEKNGDTNMHKARMGLFPGLGRGALLLSNLGGSMGCQLTALKFGVLAILAGGSEVVHCLRENVKVPDTVCNFIMRDANLGRTTRT